MPSIPMINDGFTSNRCERQFVSFEYDFDMYLHKRQCEMTDSIINRKWSANGPCIEGTHMALGTYTTDPNNRFGGKGLRLYL
jgi:hypothetical protein